MRMPDCTICGEKIPDGSRTCPICGSSADEFMPMATMLGTPPLVASATELPAALPTGGSYCPVCSKVYGPAHSDGFCSCGTELKTELRLDPIDEAMAMAPILDKVPMAPVPAEIPMAPILDDVPMAPVLEDEPMAPAPDAVRIPCVKPSSGTHAWCCTAPTSSRCNTSR